MLFKSVLNLKHSNAFSNYSVGKILKEKLNLYKKIILNKIRYNYLMYIYYNISLRV